MNTNTNSTNRDTNTTTVPILTVKELSFAYRNAPQRKILKKVSFTIERGEMIAIRGASGSGKSTLLYLLGCLMNSEQGEIFLFGQNIRDLDDLAKASFRNARIGFVFQQFHLSPHHNVLDNILLPQHYPLEIKRDQRSATRQKAEELAQLFDLDSSEHFAKFPRQLSGGQQQRVALARALINDAELILADEPTGNLDSVSAGKVMDHLLKLNTMGKTVVIVTHDPQVAERCQRVITLKDGEIIADERRILPTAIVGADVASPFSAPAEAPVTPHRHYFSLLKKTIPLAIGNIFRHKLRSFSTMLGIIVGIAAVLSMVTLGTFTKRKILDSYAVLGVNSFLFYGYPNWNLSASDKVDVKFQAFDWKNDILAARKTFPMLKNLSPMLFEGGASAFFAGNSIEGKVFLRGVNHLGLSMLQEKLMMGKDLSPLHIKNRNSVCIIGEEIYKTLFKQIVPLGQQLQGVSNSVPFTCTIIGVLNHREPSDNWFKPDMQILLPYTFMQTIASSRWSAQVHHFLAEIDPTLARGHDVVSLGKGLEAYFISKYGISGNFQATSNSVLVAQMNKFLTLFTILLTVMALVSLLVGGIGITNMMLVSISERMKEIGLRKALGATHASMRLQILAESFLLCFLAGLVGIIIGVIIYQSGIYFGSKLIPKLAFEWVFSWSAITISFSAIVTVGVLSGLIPALKAERLEVIDVLRAE